MGDDDQALIRVYSCSFVVQLCFHNTMKKLLLILAVGATFAAGFWLGRNRLSSAPPKQAATDLPPVKTAERAAKIGAAYLSAGVTEKLSVEQIAIRLEVECNRGVWRRSK